MFFITLGNGNELFVDQSNRMGIRKVVRGEPVAFIDLGDATLDTLNLLIENLQRMAVFIDSDAEDISAKDFKSIFNI